jgi:hypothetical protein
MKPTRPHPVHEPVRARRRRPNAQLGIFEVLSERQTAAAMDDAAAAEQLMDDLVALIELGLVVSIEVDGETRFAAAPVDLGEPDG